jgi:hypothetical protein
MRFRRLFLYAALAASLSGCAHHKRLTEFSYVDRPAGYDWKAVNDPNDGATVYYGTDPRNGATVYVGPDNTYYAFKHPPPIAPSDLRSFWYPQEAE